MTGNDKQFDNIVQAFAYTNETGDNSALEQYVQQKNTAMANRFMPLVASMRGDDILFLLAFIGSFSQLRLDVMTPEERQVVEMIRNTIQLTYVRVNLPFAPNENKEGDE